MHTENIGTIKYIIGVDEVGRGPLAGPVTVCAALIPATYDMDSFVLTNKEKHKISFTDSKGLNEKARNKWNAILDTDGVDFIFSIKNKTAQEIDEQGIAVCIKKLVNEVIEDVVLKTGCTPNECRIFLDGGLYAPAHFKNQSTHVKGDALFPIISFASIKAKVNRDAYMTEVAETYPEYAFAVHKGYGTLVHRTAIKKYGLSIMHRVSFCQNFI